MSLRFGEAVNESNFFFVYRDSDIGTIWHGKFHPYEDESFTLAELQEIVAFILERL